MDLYLFLGALLVLASVLASHLSSHLGVPALIFFLGVGMLAGSDGPGGFHFDDALLTQNLAVLALVVILFSGGLDTQWNRVRGALREASILATLGVFLTALLVGVFSRYSLGFSWSQGMLLGAIVASTDAAAVFSIFRSKRLALRGGSDRLLELESGSNDPMAVFLTLAMTRLLANPAEATPAAFLLLFLQQMMIGALGGLVFGLLGSRLLTTTRLQTEGLYPPLLLAWAVLSYAATALLGGSGFLACYIAGILIGNRPMFHKRSLRDFFDGLAWIMQIVMFLNLGLLVFPSRLPSLAIPALMLALFLMFVARPIAVFLCLWGSRYTISQKVFISWVGLRGAVPIILGTYPAAAGLQRGDEIFHIVFFVVLTSVMLQGSSLEQVATRLKLVEPEANAAEAPLVFEPGLPTDNDLVQLQVEPGSAASQMPLVRLGLPKGVLIVLIIRKSGYVVPSGNVQMCPGDRVMVLVQPEKLEALQGRFRSP